MRPGCSRAWCSAKLSAPCDRPELAGICAGDRAVGGDAVVGLYPQSLIALLEPAIKAALVLKLPRPLIS
ncbi:MAG: hypothetical protein MZV49_02040 [Rhodopseudomonas palustris]|nr:hypothetical protein [Rhodopseudomonas palustris]